MAPRSKTTPETRARLKAERAAKDKAAREAAAKRTSSTKAPAPKAATKAPSKGGALVTTPKPVGARRRLPPSSQGGTRVGNSSQPWGAQPPKANSPRISSTKALPPGKPGGALTTTAKPDRPLQAADGRNVKMDKNGWPKGTEKWADTKSPSAPPRTAASTPKGLSGLKGGIAGAAIYAVGEQVTNAVGQRAGEQLGKALKPVGRAIDERRAASKDTKGGRRQNQRGGGRTTGAAPTQPSKPGAKWQDTMFKGQRPSPGAPTRTASDGQSKRQDAQRASSGSVTPSSGSSRPSPARPSQAAPRTTTGAAKEGRKWEDFNKGRGTSETNNPLIKNDKWLMSKLKERDAKAEKKVDTDKDRRKEARKTRSPLAEEALESARRKKKKKDQLQSAAVSAGWDGNKNY